jgi:protein TonB
LKAIRVVKLTGLQFGLCVSLCIHAAIFGAIALGGLGRHKAHSAQLPKGDREQTITLTLVAAPDEPVAEARNDVAQIVATVLVPPTPPETPKPVETKPPAPPLPITTPVRKPEPTPLTQATVPVQKESTPTPPAIPAAPQSAQATVALNQPTQNRVRGDGSSPRPGEDTTTQQAPLGIRAQPDYRHNPEPPYPLAARRRRQEGIVLLSVKVSAQGRAVRVELKQSSGVTVLDEAAIQAVRGWEFSPARVGTTAYESEIEVPVRFKLQP